MTDPLAKLRAQFLDRTREDLAVLENTEAEPERIRFVVHRMAGSAALFGFSRAGELARALDDGLVEGRGVDQVSRAALIAELRSLLAMHG
jgi:HPt (histidine-containing phosphotransfer) domain-containing protein